MLISHEIIKGFAGQTQKACFNADPATDFSVAGMSVKTQLKIEGRI